MNDIQLLFNPVHDAVSAIDRYEASGDVCTDFQPIIIKLDYVQRIVVNLGINEPIPEMVGDAMRMLNKIEQNNRMDAGRYGVSLNREGLHGRPSFNIGEDQLAFFTGVWF